LANEAIFQSYRGARVPETNAMWNYIDTHDEVAGSSPASSTNDAAVARR